MGKRARFRNRQKLVKPRKNGDQPFFSPFGRYSAHSLLCVQQSVGDGDGVCQKCASGEEEKGSVRGLDFLPGRLCEGIVEARGEENPQKDPNPIGLGACLRGEQGTPRQNQKNLSRGGKNQKEPHEEPPPRAFFRLEFEIKDVKNQEGNEADDATDHG